MARRPTARTTATPDLFGPDPLEIIRNGFPELTRCVFCGSLDRNTHPWVIEARADRSTPEVKRLTRPNPETAILTFWIHDACCEPYAKHVMPRDLQWATTSKRMNPGGQRGPGAQGRIAKRAISVMLRRRIGRGADL